jgi:hypothetical protein
MSVGNWKVCKPDQDLSELSKTMKYVHVPIEEKQEF